MRRPALLVIACVVGCSSGSAPREPAPPADAPTPRAPDARRWIAGDLHMHVAPIDAVEGQTLDVAALSRTALAAGLEFVIATPHLRQRTWASPARRRAWLAAWSRIAAAARAQPGATVIPGVEWTVHGYGHFGVSGADLATLGRNFLGSAIAAGAFVVVNHPFAVPTNVPGVPISHRDLSFRPWTDGRGAVPRVDGVEVMNLPLALANLWSRPDGQSGDERAFAAADALVRRERRRVAIVGGSDSHTGLMTPTTWVLAADASEAAILAGLRFAATCIGGPEAGTLEARGDGDPADRWSRVGDSVRAAHTVVLRWHGRARVFVDGADAGVHDGGYVHAGAAGLHTYRIEIGASRSGFVYANLG